MKFFKRERNFLPPSLKFTELLKYSKTSFFDGFIEPKQFLMFWFEIKLLLINSASARIK